jgi:hypothetical protein
MKRICFSILVLFIATCSNAQLSDTDYNIKSTIITNTDTIECYLPYESKFNSTVEYKLSKEDKNRDKKSISINEIVRIKRSFDIYDKLYFNDQPIILRLVRNGQVVLYENDIQGDVNYNSGKMYITPEKTIFFIEKDKILYKIRNSSKKKDLKAILTGNPEITEMIDNIENSRFESQLKKIIEKYNSWLKISTN